MDFSRCNGWPALLITMALLVTNPTPAAGDSTSPALERTIRLSVDVNAAIDEVWHAWTTNDGAKSFFAPDSHIETRVDGAYDIYFFPHQPVGSRGAEGMRVLAIDAPEFVAFTWNAPPSIPSIRTQRTVVTIYLETLEEGLTRVHLIHMGWGVGPDWDAAFAYFNAAWRDVILPRLVYRFEHGPVDWRNPPTGSAAAQPPAGTLAK